MFSISWVQLAEYQSLMELLEDKQSLRREDCNVPIFGFPYYAVRFTSGGLSPPGQRGETMTSERSEGLEEFCGAQLGLFTFIHHRDPFCTTCLWFHCIPTISVILSYYGAYFN
jgi:hypothetical protein